MDKFVVEKKHVKYGNGIIFSKILTLNHYLGNKKIMYDILSNDPRAFDFLPLTAPFNVIESDYRNIIHHAMTFTPLIKTWILKPAVGLQGKDITISDDSTEMINFVNSNPHYSDWVISQYIDNPFLLKLKGNPKSGVVYNDTIGRKVHIRIYVLVTRINNETHIYLYKHNLIFCAVAEYKFDDLKYEYSNLTNLHLGSIYYNKILKKDGKQAYKDLSFPLIETVSSLFGSEFYNKVVFPQLKNMLIVIFENSKDDFLKCDTYCTKNEKCKDLGCYQYIAIDIMPDDNFKLILLEINGNPGLNAPNYHWGGTETFKNNILEKLESLIDKTENDNEFTLIK